VYLKERNDAGREEEETTKERDMEGGNAIFIDRERGGRTQSDEGTISGIGGKKFRHYIN